MFFLLSSLLFINLYTGFLIFEAFSRTKRNENVLTFLMSSAGAIILVFLFLKTTHQSFLIACTPLLIGFLNFTVLKLKNSRNEIQNLNSIVIFLEMTSIYMRAGRSFVDSTHKSQQMSLNKRNCTFLIKKNVVMQQPKSRNHQIFDELREDLQLLANLKVGKLELLDFLKQKFETNMLLKQKIKVSTTQYRAQSAVLLLFWSLCLISLIYKSSIEKYIHITTISFLMLIIGHMLSKKMLVKNDFRI